MTTKADIVRRMAERLPRVMEGGTNVQVVLRALAGELEALDRANLTLMRSRWSALARAWDEVELKSRTAESAHTERSESELGRIGELFGLAPERGEQPAYFRQRLRRFVLLHRFGLGSAPALLGLAALVYHTEDTPHFWWNGPRAMARFHARDRSGLQREVTLALEDNPTQARTKQFETVEAGVRLPVVNDGLAEAVPSFELVALDRAVSFPVIEQVESGARILFLGRLEAGERLVLEQGRLPLVSGIPGRADMLVGSGYRFDAEQARFGGELAYFAAFSAQRSFPSLANGESRWRYDRLDRDRLAYYVADRPDAETLLDLADAAGSAPLVKLTVRWEEQRPGCFVLRIPAHFVPAHLDDFPALTRRLARALDYGRAAGVEARLQAVLGFREGLAPEEAWHYRAEHLGRMDQQLGDAFGAPKVRLRLAEDAAPGEGLAGPDGAYDETYFNHATLVDETRVDYRARFDTGYFNGHTFVDVFETGELGRYGTDRYDAARFAQDHQEDS